jgi:excinuclease ABC subunit C
MKEENTHSHLQNTLIKNIPKSPGVYKFFDDEKKLLYIGKAVCLKNRVQSYFRKASYGKGKTKKLVEKIQNIEWTSTRSEAEALVLEANLIHRYKPPFNILLREDKRFLYLKITKDPFPRIEFTRFFEKDGAVYFGPYVKATPIRKTIDFLREVLQFRTCRVGIDSLGNVTKNPENKKIPCLDYQLHRCSAPCDHSISKEKYNKDIQKMIRFLKGNTFFITEHVKKEMFKASEKKEFERAARFRDLLKYAENFGCVQAANISQNFSGDVIGVHFGADQSFFHLLCIRQGKILRSENFSLQNEETHQETFSTFLREYLSLTAEIPPYLLVPNIFPQQDSSLWESFTDLISQQKITIHIPLRGKKKELLEIAQKNAYLHAINSKANFEKQDVLHLLQKALSLPTRPERIECYDISHLSGTHPVGSQVVFLDGKPEKSEYRRYKIQSLLHGKSDDFAALAEVLGRRLKRFLNRQQEIEIQKIQKKSEQEEIQRIMQKQNISGIPQSTSQFLFTEKQTGKKIGYAQKGKRGKICEIGGILLLPTFQKEGVWEEIVKLIIATSSEKTVRLLIPKENIRQQLSLKSIGFLEEKYPPKSFQSPSPENNTSERISFKISPEKFKKYLKKIPDLLVIDGGKGQLSSVVKVLKTLGLFPQIPVCSLAKKEESIFLPGKSHPLPLAKEAPENQLLQRIRDEAHRFAIGFNRYLRKKSETRSVLDDIPGIGEKTKQMLLKKFQTPKNVLSASDEELREYVSPSVIEHIRSHAAL